MATKVSLRDLIKDFDKEVYNLLYTEYRPILDQRPHVLDISLNSLQVNNKHEYSQYSQEDFEELHDVFLQVVSEKATRKYNSIEEVPRDYFTGKTPYLVYIDGGKHNQLLLARSFEAIRTFVTNKISKDKRLVDTIFGLRVSSRKPVLNRAGKPTGDEKITYVTNVELGHIATEGISGDVLTSPLIEKGTALLNYAELSGSSLVSKYVNEALDKIYAIQADINYSFKNTTPEGLNKLTDTFGQLYVVVTLHTYEENQRFSRLEAEIFRELERKLAMLASKPLVANYMKNMVSSNTMEQDLAEGFYNLIKHGKTSLAKHTTKAGKTPKKLINKPKKITGSGKFSTSVKSPQPSGRDVGGDLIGLRALLNQLLPGRVAFNMGKGNRKDILNYRTGRFSNSTEVQRLSISREGMITAFYSYMKYPYATFSAGGAQEYPRTRDPKLLISKSIREIAATVVSNRLRAVLV